MGRREGASRPTVCEVAIFRVCASRHLPGEAFDPVAESRRGRKATRQTLGKLPGEAITGACDALCSRGHLEALGKGFYSLTDEGEARYRAGYDAERARARGIGARRAANRG